MIPEAYVGHVAALTTACLWAFTSVFFSAAAQRLGAPAVNAWRLAAAVVFLSSTHLLRTGGVWPEAAAGQVWLLAASGLIGLTIGDQALFQAFLDIGPRLSLLVMTSAPLFAALFGLLALGEQLSGLALLGMLITIGGIAWVVLEKPSAAGGATAGAGRGPAFARGVALAVLAAACQAGGFLLSKLGIGHGWLATHEHLAPLSATLVRMVFAAAAAIPLLWIWRALRPSPPRVGSASEQHGRIVAGLGFATCGAVAGPYLGVWMSLVASDHAPLGVAQTLMSLTPITILPFSIWLYRERLTLRSVGGSLVAIAGAALLFVGV